MVHRSPTLVPHESAATVDSPTSRVGMVSGGSVAGSGSPGPAVCTLRSSVAGAGGSTWRSAEGRGARPAVQRTRDSKAGVSTSCPLRTTPWGVGASGCASLVAAIGRTGP